METQMQPAAKSWVLPSHATSPAKARRHVAEACRGLSRDLVDLTLLLTSEVVTNAIAHGRGHVRMSVSRGESDLRVDVEDKGAGRPCRSVTDPGPLAESGRGLVLLEALASEWGTTPSRPPSLGKRVWFRMRT